MYRGDSIVAALISAGLVAVVACQVPKGSAEPVAQEPAVAQEPPAAPPQDVAPGQPPPPPPEQAEPQPLAPADVVATVNGVAITAAELIMYFTDGEVLALDGVSDPARKQWMLRTFELEAVQRAIDNLVLYLAAVESGIAFTESDIDMSIEELLEKLDMTLEEYEESLAREGLTLDQYRQMIMRSYSANVYLRLAQPRTPEEVLTYYRDKATIAILIEAIPEPMPRPIDVSTLLTVEDVHRELGTTAEFTTDRIGDEPTTATYDSWHFRAKDGGESHDVAYRVWLGTADELAERYESLAQQLPGATNTNRVGDASLKAEQFGVRGYAALSYSAGVVILVTCGTSLCADDAATEKLLRLLLDRSARLR